MKSHYGRRIPPAGVERKRKERENPCFTSGPPPEGAAPINSAAHSADAREAGGSKPMCSNRLLAGYMAHEFLTRGTLLGQKFESLGAEAEAGSSAKSHAEMASIVRSDGTHIPGVVNPSQLSRWMQA